MAVQEILRSNKPESELVDGDYFMTVQRFCRLTPLLTEDEVVEYLASRGFNTQELNNESYTATLFHFWPIAKERDYADRARKLRRNCKRTTVQAYAERMRRLRTKGKRNTAGKYSRVSLSAVRKYLRTFA